MSESHSHHAHSHHGHHHATDNVGRLKLVLALTALYMLIEFIGGMLANSLSLMADAGHMLADVGAIGMALFATWFSQRGPSDQKTYGYYRLEIFAAFLNGILLVVISGFIFFEAVQRFQHPQLVKGNLLALVAGGGLIINLISARILVAASHDNLNMRGVFFHVLSDCLGSGGALIAGLLVLSLGFYQADPLFSALIAVLILVNAWGLIQETTHILLEGVPTHLSVQAITDAMLNLPEILAVHDLHVWSITSGKEALSAHLVVSDPGHYHPNLIAKVQTVMKEKFNLTHLTLQLEPPDFDDHDTC